MKKISDSNVRRLSGYLRLLQEAHAAGMFTISSEELARRGGTTSAQVRKDLSVFGSFGKRGLGYPVPALLGSLRDILGVNRTWSVALIGAGKIGAALFSYRDFQARGFHIRAVFDADPAKIGQQWGDLVVQADDCIEQALARDRIDMAIIAVPADAAHTVADRVVRAGVRAILNFAPVQLQLPESVAYRAVDMAVELEGLAFALNGQ